MEPVDSLRTSQTPILHDGETVFVADTSWPRQRVVVEENTVKLVNDVQANDDTNLVLQAFSRVVRSARFQQVFRITDVVDDEQRQLKVGDEVMIEGTLYVIGTSVNNNPVLRNASEPVEHDRSGLNKLVSKI